VYQIQVTPFTSKSDENRKGTGPAPSRREITYAVVFRDQANANRLMEVLDEMEQIENIRLRFETTSNEL
jgi:hypothetical protein